MFSLSAAIRVFRDLRSVINRVVHYVSQKHPDVFFHTQCSSSSGGGGSSRLVYYYVNRLFTKVMVAT